MVRKTLEINNIMIQLYQNEVKVITESRRGQMYRKLLVQVYLSIAIYIFNIKDQVIMSST